MKELIELSFGPQLQRQLHVNNSGTAEICSWRASLQPPTHLHQPAPDFSAIRNPLIYFPITALCPLYLGKSGRVWFGQHPSHLEILYFASNSSSTGLEFFRCLDHSPLNAYFTGISLTSPTSFITILS